MLCLLTCAIVEVWGLMATLFARSPNIATLSLSTDWYEMPLKSVIKGLSRMRSLSDVRFVMAGDITPLLGALCKHVRDLPRLQHLCLQYSGTGSAYTSFVSPSELPSEGPGISFEKLTLRIGTSSPVALRYITWLSEPREGDNQFTLKSLSLDLSRGHYSEKPCIDALVPCLSNLGTLWLNVTGLGDGVLERVLQCCEQLKKLTLVIRHNFIPAMAYLLPTTLEEYRLEISFADPGSGDWDARLASFIRDRRPSRLQHFFVRSTCLHGFETTEDVFPLSRKLAKERGLNAVFQVKYSLD